MPREMLATLDKENMTRHRAVLTSGTTSACMHHMYLHTENVYVACTAPVTPQRGQPGNAPPAPPPALQICLQVLR